MFPDYCYWVPVAVGALLVGVAGALTYCVCMLLGLL